MMATERRKRQNRTVLLLKHTFLAHILYSNLNDPVADFRKGDRLHMDDRKRIGLIFDRDDASPNKRLTPVSGLPK
jgi:hypothetical protein